MTETTRLLADDIPPRRGVLRVADEVQRSTAPVATLGIVADLLTEPGASSPLVEFEDRVLRRLGGGLGLPPRLDEGWEHGATLDDLTDKAHELVESGVFDLRLLGIGDPRAAVLAPFWQKILGRPILAAVFIDEPHLAGAVLARRIGCSRVLGLARYERYYRAVTSSLANSSVYVVALRGDQRDIAEIDEAARHLELDSTDYEQVVISRRQVDKDVALHATNGADHDDVLTEIATLFESFASRAGSNANFSTSLTTTESSWTTELLRAERDLEHVVDGLDWAAQQIEPIVRATPSPVVIDDNEAQPGAEAKDEVEFREPEKDEPYPLNASEDRRGYHRWLRARHEPVVIGGPDDPTLRRAKTRAPRNHGPLVSVVVPVWRTPLWALERCVSSVLAQTVGDWELCLCDDASGDAELTSYLNSLHRVDRRISTCTLEENGGISAATNAAITISSGQFVAFLDHDDELAPNALEEVEKAIALWPDADVLYSDEDKIEALGERFDPLFKPDWSPDLLLSFAYICHLTVVRHELLSELGGLRTEFDGSQDYDLSLRATERARRIVHIPEILYHWRTLPGSAASDSPGAVAKPWAYEAGRRAIEDALARRGERVEVTADERFPGRYHVRRAITSRPLVSIIVPFRDEPALLATCAASLRADPGYDRTELVLVDNGSELPETAALLERLQDEGNVVVVDAPGPFNWAAINNAAVHQARGEMLLFANNDIEARVPRWLDALLGHALRQEVGAVGARLIYPDGAIQHAGVVIGLGGIAGHPLRGLPGWHPGYNSMAIQTRNCSVVTGACMMTRREIFESVGGFNELLPVAFNDVDYCLKLREKGYLIVYTPLAELIHHESRSRGHTDDLVESRRIVSRWGDAIAAGDPYLNMHLSHWRYWCPLSTPQEDDRWKTYLETSVLTRVSSPNT